MASLASRSLCVRQQCGRRSFRLARQLRALSTYRMHSPKLVPKELLNRINQFAKQRISKDEVAGGRRLGARKKETPEKKEAQKKPKLKGSPTKEDIAEMAREAKSDPRSYALNGMCQDLHVVYRIFDYLRVKEKNFSPKRILDYGCGTGGVLWALLDLFEVSHYTGVEEEENLLLAAERLCSGFHLRTRWEKQIPKNTKYDLIVAVDSLSHLSSRARRKALDKLWESCEGMLIVVNHGRRAFQTTNQARDFFLQKNLQEQRKRSRSISDGTDDEKIVPGGRIVAPCPHMQDCPMQGMKYGCHFGIRIPKSDFPSKSEQAEIQPKSQIGNNILGSYSYVVFDKRSGQCDMANTNGTGPDSSSSSTIAAGNTNDGLSSSRDVGNTEEIVPKERLDEFGNTTEKIRKPYTLEKVEEHRYSKVVSPPLKKGGHVLLELCTPDGAYLRANIGRSTGDAFKSAKYLQWGDHWEYQIPSKGILKRVSAVEVATMPESGSQGASKSSTHGETVSSGRVLETEIKFSHRGKRSGVKMTRGEREVQWQKAERGLEGGEVEAAFSEMGMGGIPPYASEDEPPMNQEDLLFNQTQIGEDDVDFELAEAVKELEMLKREHSEVEGWEDDKE